MCEGKRATQIHTHCGTPIEGATNEGAVLARAKREGWQADRVGDSYRLTKGGADHTISNLAEVVSLLDDASTADDAENSAAARKAQNAKSEWTHGDGSGCDYDPADPLPGDNYSSIWKRRIEVA